MADYTNVLNKTADLEYGPAFAPYTGVRLWYDDENAFFAGDETGSVLEADCPWATQAMADNILANVGGYVYQPFEATDAFLDPAAELGDGVGVGNIFGPLASVSRTLDSLAAADIGAPEEEEVEYEFPYISPTQRALMRKVTLGADYYGTRITRANGLEIVKTAADGTEKSRAKLNADELSFYDDNGGQALYFDPNTGRYMFRGDIVVTGNINMSQGSITWGPNNPADGSGISASQARTIISEELVSSPTIAGGKFMDLDESNWLQMGENSTGSVGYLHHYYSGYSSNSPVCAMGYLGGIYDSWVIAPFNKFAMEFQDRGDTYPYTYVYGEWNFSQADVTGLYLRFS